jgi:hypothetical protein
VHLLKSVKHSHDFRTLAIRFSAVPFGLEGKIATPVEKHPIALHIKVRLPEPSHEDVEWASGSPQNVVPADPPVRTY